MTYESHRSGLNRRPLGVQAVDKIGKSFRSNSIASQDTAGKADFRLESAPRSVPQVSGWNGSRGHFAMVPREINSRTSRCPDCLGPLQVGAVRSCPDCGFSEVVR